MGAMHKDTYSDICKIGEIRNLFAHNLDSASFEDETIMEKCGKFAYLLDKRQWYQLSITIYGKRAVPQGGGDGQIYLAWFFHRRKASY